MSSIDLNCDLGESFGRWRLGEDEAMLDLVTSANVACGFHAGDPSTMRATAVAARDRGVRVGAHPGYADLRGFGRIPLELPADQLADDLIYQLGALSGICATEGIRLTHVKPHGALYNAAAADLGVARVVIDVVRAFDPDLALLLPAASDAAAMAAEAGLHVVPEAFVDREYRNDGRLLPRSDAAAIVSDVERMAARAVRLAREGTVEAADGTVLELHPATLCIHGDTPGAPRIAREVRSALREAGIEVAPFA